MGKLLGKVLFAIGILGIFACISIFALIALDVMSIGISPLYSYRLTEHEAAVLDVAHAELHRKMAHGEFDQIAEGLADARVSKDENIRKIREARQRFGAPSGFEFFRAAEPQPAANYYPDHQGTNYVTYYFANGQDSEFSESIDWLVDNSGGVLVRNYTATAIAEWEQKNRERERELSRLFRNELRLPIFGYFMEIRY